MIGFAGLSHLGIVYSLATAAKGFDVVGYTPDPEGVGRLSGGVFPVEEPGLRELFALHRARIRYSSDPAALAPCETIFVAQDIETDDTGASRLGPLEALVETVLPHVGGDTSLVVLSQVRPGFTRSLARRAAPMTRSVLYQVETLVFGAAVGRALHPERFIVGVADPGRPLPAPYRRWLEAFGCPVLVMGYESAEVAKTAINLLLVSSVTTTNTLAELCESLGADWSEIVPALRLDKRIGPHAYLGPGLGLAGGNLERDLVTVEGLAAEHGTDARVVAAWRGNSAYRKDWTLRTLHRHVLPACPEPVVGMLGLAYKANTASTRHSASLRLISDLGGRPIRLYDPVARLEGGVPPHVRVCGSAMEAVEGSDVVAIMTPWDEFAALDPARVRDRMRSRFVLDPFGAWDGGTVRGLGLRYFRLGAAAVG
jgi:UDPglucose 6-dehydrogenase